MHWADVGAIAFVAFWCFLASASVADYGVDLKLDAAASGFVAGTIAVVAISTFAIGRHRSDPWSIETDRVPWVLAWSVSGMLCFLALAMIDSVVWPAFGFPVVAAAIWRKAPPKELIPQNIPVAVFSDLQTPDAFCEGVRKATLEQRRRWLEGVLSLPSDDRSMIVLLEVFERSASLLERPLLELLQSPSPRVQTRAAFYLAWFGSPEVIPELQRVEGTAAGVASEAARRVLARSAPVGERGGLSLVGDSSSGRLSIPAVSGRVSLGPS